MIGTLFESPTLTTGSAHLSPSRRAICPGFAMKTPIEAATAEPEANAVRSGHLLVVDDHEVNRDMLSRRLRDQGYRVSVVEDGLRVLRAVRAEPVDLVLLDVLMPEMDGATRRTVAGEDFNRAMLRIGGA